MDSFNHVISLALVLLKNIDFHTLNNDKGWNYAIKYFRLIKKFSLLHYSSNNEQIVTFRTA